MMRLKFDFSFFALLISCLLVAVLSKTIQKTDELFEYSKTKSGWKSLNDSDLNTETNEMAKILGYNNIENCRIPDVIKNNSILYDYETSGLNLIKLLYIFRKLFKQMILRYGLEDVNRALKGLPSSIRFDPIDNIFLDMNIYVTCLKRNKFF